MQKYLFYLSTIVCFLSACQSPKTKVDLIIHHATVYTVNAGFAKAEAFAVKDGRFIAIGTSGDILKKYESAQTIDAQGKPVYPGFYDAHCHFYNYGKFLQEIDLIGTRSWGEVIQKVKTYASENPEKKWIIGRGWDQNDWAIQKFPVKDTLDALFPNKSVLLTRIDGHAAIANQAALEKAGIQPDTQVEGGIIQKTGEQLTGILVDNAIDLVSEKIPSLTEKEIEKALFEAQEKCFAVGLTTVSDAGLPRKIIEAIDKMQQKGSLQMRVYAMISATPQEIDYYLQKGTYKTNFLNVRSFKIYADGALGSRGACLLENYKDKPNETGFLLTGSEKLEEIIQKVGEKGFQANTHCIGDSANRLVLNIYGKYLKGKNNKRWRIEHAQVVNKEDIDKFGKYGILPSVQPTHCTSDMFWAMDRLGKKRLRTAYAYKDLYAQNQMIPLGSDFPVEDINPLYGFHAAVARKDVKNNPENGFQMENALDRTTALKGMTIWAAYANFEEEERGSIEKGKMADFVILESDIMKEKEEKLRSVKVLQTYVNGKAVYKKRKTAQVF